MNIDFLIIGQGLAGTVLSQSLKSKNRSFLFIDKGHKNSASRAAAGIFNPITGRQMRKTWMAAELFDYLPDFYKEFEKLLEIDLLHFMPVLRMFDSQKQVNDWHGQLERPGIEDFLERDKSEYPKNIKAPFGLYATKKSGYLDVPLLIKTYREYLKKESLLIEEDFQYSALKFSDKAIEYKNIRAERIIFCEGAMMRHNPFLKYLPLVPNKGEILEVEIKDLDNGHIYNKNGFLMPRTNKHFWVGATYHRDKTDVSMSDIGYQELKAKVEGITQADYQVKSTYVGVRPTVRDRRPLIGLHPENEQIGIFNGLGSKGVSLGPYWANVYSEFLVDNKELPSEVNITRYNSLF